MSALLLSTDLMFGPRVTSAARALGDSCRMISLAQLGESLSPEVRLVLVDLSLPGLDVGQVVAQVRAGAESAAVVAFGPHVHADRLKAAVDAGCERVISRGELHAQLPAILGRYLSSGDQSDE